MIKRFYYGLKEAQKRGELKVGDKVRVPNSSGCWSRGEQWHEITDFDGWKHKNIDNNGEEFIYHCACSDLEKPFELEIPEESFKDLPAKEQGIDTSRYFTVIKNGNYYYKNGDLVKINYDDNTKNPFFAILNRKPDYEKTSINWVDVRYATREEIDSVLNKPDKNADIAEETDSEIHRQEQILSQQTTQQPEFNNEPQAQFNKIIKKTMLQELTTTLKKLLPSNIQKQYKAGYRNGGLELTETGKEVLFQIVADKFEKELTDSAIDLISKEEKKK